MPLGEQRAAGAVERLASQPAGQRAAAVVADLEVGVVAHPATTRDEPPDEVDVLRHPQGVVEAGAGRVPRTTRHALGSHDTREPGRTRACSSPRSSDIESSSYRSNQADPVERATPRTRGATAATGSAKWRGAR